MKHKEIKTLLTIKTNKSIKEMAQEVAHEIGVPLSTVVNAFLKQFVRDREVSFSASYNPSPLLKSEIEETNRDFKEGKLKSVKGIEGLRKSLES